MGFAEIMATTTCREIIGATTTLWEQEILWDENTILHLDALHTFVSNQNGETTMGQLPTIDVVTGSSANSEAI